MEFFKSLRAFGQEVGSLTILHGVSKHELTQARANFNVFKILQVIIHVEKSVSTNRDKLKGLECRILVKNHGHELRDHFSLAMLILKPNVSDWEVGLVCLDIITSPKEVRHTVRHVHRQLPKAKADRVKRWGAQDRVWIYLLGKLVFIKDPNGVFLKICKRLAANQSLVQRVENFEIVAAEVQFEETGRWLSEYILDFSVPSK